MADRGIDLLDFYRGRISMRRMVLHVIHDLERMPRTRAAVEGLDSSRPWDEINTQIALLDTRIQALLRVMWVGLRLKGDPPKVSPYPVPAAKGKQAPEQRRGPDPRKQAYLERFAPPKRHLKLVKTPPPK